MQGEALIWLIEDGEFFIDSYDFEFLKFNF